MGVFITLIGKIVSAYYSICLECCFICPRHLLRNPGSTSWIIRNRSQNSIRLCWSSTLHAENEDCRS